MIELRSSLLVLVIYLRSVDAEATTGDLVVDGQKFEYTLDADATLLSWADAQQACETDGGNLLSISNADELQYLLNSVMRGANGNRFWIGLTDPQIAQLANTDPTQMTWSDGSTVTYLGSTKNFDVAGDCADYGKNSPGGDQFLLATQDCATTQLYMCEKLSPPSAGGYGSWQGSGVCDVPCGQGSETFTRACDNPPPVNGGDDCSVLGPDTETRSCDTGITCPTDGGYGAWSNWGTCVSVTGCGTGSEERRRACDTPTPDPGGADCSGLGPATETRVCDTGVPCPVDGAYGQWTTWVCKGPCDGFPGIQSRNRTCDSPAPAHGGASCANGASETETGDLCLTDPCGATSVRLSLAMALLMMLVALLNSDVIRYI